ncbi:class I SAM-dependent methyltransferase [Mycoplasma tauri]|uniref:C-5 cytosine-specific DNA methyltransferase n=1 Tax=Mycoplasma tauri TaxID=547987 RepID=UPI001E5DC546|nr:C-5 cytosine-specific DNA methyltransferase [Mycoplasma tauri]
MKNNNNELEIEIEKSIKYKQIKIIVWDLFGGGQNSVYKALKDNPNYEIYTFDLYPEKYHENQHIIDLSLDITTLKEYFSKFPKPDIIAASPLCQSFSSILSLKGGGTCFWEYQDNSKTALKERSIDDFNNLKNGFTRNFDANKQLFIKRLGENCINNTIDIIKEFKPKYWYIENPKGSLMWKFIQYNRKDFYKADFIFNKTYYGEYGYLQAKPTIFLSNVYLNLKNKNNLKTIKKDGYKEIYKNNVLISKMLIGDRLLPSLKNYRYKSIGNFQSKEAAMISYIPADLIKTIFISFNLSKE